jgi:hypothetical protein
MSLNPFAEPLVQSVGNIAKTLAYGAALNARQPVYMQADGKVYPIVGSGGSLTGSPPATFFVAVTEGSCLTPVNATPNRFLWCVAHTDNNLYQQVYDVNPATGALAITPVTNLASVTPNVVVGDGACSVVNQAGTKGLLAYAAAAGLNIFPLIISGSGAITGVSASTTVGGSAPSPMLLNTTNPNKFLISFRSSTNHVVGSLDTSGAIAYTQLATGTLNIGAVRSTGIAKLDSINKFVWVSSQANSISIQPFTFDPILNTYAILGSGSIYANVGAGGLTFDVVYRDSVEAWLVVNRDSAPTQISTHKIDLNTGNVTNFAQANFNGVDSLTLPLRTLVTGHRPSTGKFLVSWFVTGTPTQSKTGEFTLNRVSGTFTTSLTGFLNSTLSGTPTQGRGFGENTSGLGYGFRNFGFASSNQVQTFGNFTTAAPAVLMLGMNQQAGPLNNVGTVDLIGSISTGHIGLTPGSVYYADLATGGITLNASSGIIAGRALSATELQIMNN